MNKISKKIISVFMALCLAISGVVIAYADETTTKPAESGVTVEEAQQTLEEQRAQLEQKLKDSQEKLKKYEKSAKATEEYINALDEKIGYLNEELNLLDKEVSEAQAKVDAYNKQVSTLKKELSELNAKYTELNTELTALDDDFQATYDAYCTRLRAMYISGTNSVLVALLTSKDLSQFISRYEMIRAVSRSDTKLMKQVNSQIKVINDLKKIMDDEKAVLDAKNADLTSKQSVCQAEQDKVESKQQEIANKKITIAEERAKSDALLAEYAEKTHMYGEYRNEDEELINSVNSEIEDLLSGLKQPDEVTTAVASGNSSTNQGNAGSNTGALFAKSNAVLSLTYPVPAHHGVSQVFGHYHNGKPHTGIDYPCPVGSKVVAAQKGIVVKVRRLNYSYGYYVMVYHGTDKQGRKIVTLYAHNSAILVSVGQTVTKGQQIAKSGNTGNSTGPHCHFEMIIDGQKVNPKNYLVK